MTYGAIPTIGQDPWGVDLIGYFNAVNGFTPQNSGAKANGTVDDTAAIQAAVDLASAAGGPVFIPAAHYKISAAINVPGNVHVYGAGNGATFIEPTGDSDGFVIAAHDDFPVRAGIHNLRVSGPGSGTGRGIVISALDDFAPAYGGVVEKVYVENMGSHGFHFDGTFGTQVLYCDAWTCGGKGFFADGGTFANDKSGGTVSTGTFETSMTFVGCYANGCEDWGYDIRKQTYCSYINCSADSNHAGAYQVYDCTGITFESCGAESTDDPDKFATLGKQPYGWKISGSAALGTDGIVLSGCYAYCITQIPFWWLTDHHVTLGDGRAAGVMIGCRELTIDGVNGDFEYGLRMDAGSYVTLVGCSLQGAPATAHDTEMHISDGAKPMFISPADAAGNALGITFSNGSPTIFPYTDSIQINATGVDQVPLVVTQFAGTTNADIARFHSQAGEHKVSIGEAGDGQVKFGHDETVSITRYGNGFLMAPTSTGVFNTGAALQAAFPASSYYLFTAAVENWIVGGVEYGPKVAISNGSTWLAEASYSQPHD